MGTKKFLVWTILSLFLLSPSGAFAQSIPGPSVSGGTSATIVPPMPLPTGAATEATLDALRTNIDDPTTATNPGVLAIVRLADDDVPNPPVGADGDATFMQVDENGRLFTSTTVQGTLNTEPGYQRTIDDLQVGSAVASIGAIVDHELSVQATNELRHDRIRIDDKGAVWVRDAQDEELELHAATSSNSDGTTIDVSGVTAVLVHSTTSAGWNRTATIRFRGAMGGGALSEFRELPYYTYQNASSGINPVYRNGLGSDPLPANASDQRAWLVDVTGFQGFQASLVFSAGSAGDVEIHAHLVKNVRVHDAGAALVITPNQTGIASEMSLQIAGLTGPVGSGVPTPFPLETVNATVGSTRVPIAAEVDDVLLNSFSDGTSHSLYTDTTGALHVKDRTSGTNVFTITDTGIAAASQNFAFGFTSEKVLISTPATNGDDVCIDHAGGTAVCPAVDTAGDDRLAPGTSIALDAHAITSVSAISASGTNTITIRAFN